MPEPVLAEAGNPALTHRTVKALEFPGFACFNGISKYSIIYIMRMKAVDGREP